MQLAHTLRFLAGMTSLLIFAALTFKEIMPKNVEQVYRACLAVPTTITGYNSLRISLGLKIEVST